MKRGGYIQRKTRIKRSNPKRKAERFRRAFLSVERVLWIKAQPCAVRRESWPWGVQCVGVIENAHVRNRGNGGTWREIVPLCKRHHAEQHTGIKTFAAKYGLDLAAIAAELATRGPQE